MIVPTSPYPILYEDNHLIAVLKPADLLTQGDETGDPNLLDELKAFIKIRDQKPGNVFLGMVHRLDRPVGGIVLFAKTSKGASRISEQFREGSIQKTYRALVDHMPPEMEGELTHYLSKDEMTNRTHVSREERAQAKKSTLGYKVLGQVGDYFDMEIKPKTGRSHQIRASLAAIGCPIVGDRKYRSTKRYRDGIALRATGLSFAQPVTKEKIELAIPPAWND
ncbi:RluA family pseudouridine synthase [Candidatus Uhrbacteria bacterium]|nr:RluA family pseudouridine synthase [Candidatus Uhrbacteria bacterium]